MSVLLKSLIAVVQERNQPVDITPGFPDILLQSFLLHITDSIPQIANYAMFLTEQQEPERGISELQKLSGIIKEYHSDDCLDYVKVQETLGTIPLSGSCCSVRNIA